MIRSMPLVGLEAARLGAHLEQRDARRCRRSRWARGLRIPAARARRGKSSSRSIPLRSRCASMRASEVSMRCTSDSLLISSEKNATGTLLLDGGVLRDVQHERRLAHRRTRRDDDQVGGLEARRHLVEVREAARHAGDRVAAARASASMRSIVGQSSSLMREKPSDVALLRDLEDLLLGDVEQLGGGLPALERLADDRRRDLDEPAQQRLLADDLRVVLDVRRGRHGVDEEADVVLAAGAVELAAPRRARRRA